MSVTAALPNAPRPTWRELLEQQDGVLSRRQALISGVTEDAWQWQLDTGRWRPLLPGVIVAHNGEPTERQRAWAAVLHTGDEAALSGDAALIELGMKLPAPKRIHVGYSERRDVLPQQFLAADREPSDVRLVPCRVGRLEEWTHPVAAPRRLRVAPATLHAAAWALSDRAGEWRLAAAVQQRLVTVPALRLALVDMPRLPRRRLIRDVLDDVELGAHARSELDFLRFLRTNDLPAPDRLQRVPRRGKRCYLDAWWERQRVAAEIDGAHHREVGSWDADVLRANSVVVAEQHDRILLLRFTMGNLRHDGPEVAGQLRSSLL